jgi:SprT protein
MHDNLESYIPSSALPLVLKLLEHEHLVVKIKNERKTRLSTGNEFH